MNSIKFFGSFISSVWDNLSKLEFFDFGFTYASLLKYLLLFGFCFLALSAIIRMGHISRSTVNSVTRE